MNYEIYYNSNIPDSVTIAAVCFIEVSLNKKLNPADYELLYMVAASSYNS